MVQGVRGCATARQQRVARYPSALDPGRLRCDTPTIAAAQLEPATTTEKNAMNAETRAKIDQATKLLEEAMVMIIDEHVPDGNASATALAGFNSGVVAVTVGALKRIK